MIVETHSKKLNMTLDDSQTIATVSRALSSPLRLDILSLLSKGSMSVVEIAKNLDVPTSSVALSIQILEDAGMISTELQAGKRGSMKLCSLNVTDVSISIFSSANSHQNKLVMVMPIGGFSAVESVAKTCGIAGKSSVIGEMDDVESFYMPERFGAQLIWFRSGTIEYRFSHTRMHDIEIDWLELSFEACSEAPMYRNPWKSDISVSINGVSIGAWTCPCDCGGRQGKLTPDWWPELSTQFGFLKTWKVTPEGTYLDSEKISSVTVAELNLQKGSYIDVKISSDANAENPGGLNLFGECFGDYQQPIIMTIGYHLIPLNSGTQQD